MQPVIALLTARIRYLDKEIQRLQNQVDYHKRIAWDKEFEIMKREQELETLLDHARDLSRKAKEEANGGS